MAGPELTKYVKESFRGLGVKRKREPEPKSALSTFAKIMGDNMENTKTVETKKLKFEEEKFKFSRELEEKKLEIELTKVREYLNKT